MLITASFSFGVAIAGYLASLFSTRDVEPPNAGTWWWIAAATAWSGFYLFLSWALAQRTPGMAVLGIRVTGDDGGALGTRAALVRVATFPLSFVLGLGFVGVVIGRRRRALHDVCARARSSSPTPSGPSRPEPGGRTLLDMSDVTRDRAEPTALPQPHDAPDRHELVKEGATMALYVAVCLLAALIALSPRDIEHARALELLWGTTVGLALAHLFAFSVASRLVTGGSFHRRDSLIAVSQLAGAAGVAVIASLPIVVLPASSEFDVARIDVAAMIGAVGYLTAREGGAGRMRSAVGAVVVLVVAASIALVKNALIGH